MAARSLTLAVGAVAVEHGRMARSLVGTRVDRVAPEPRQPRLTGARRQGSDRRVVSPDHRVGHHRAADQFGQRPQPPGDVADPFGHGRTIDLDALALQDDRLPVERDAVAVLRDGDMRQQPRSRPAPLDRQCRRCHLEYPLTQPAGVFGPDVLDHLQAGRDFLQHLGRALAEPGQAGGVAAAADAGDLRCMHDHFARQVSRQRLALRGWAARLRCGVRLGGLGGGRDLFAAIRLEVLELQFELVDVAVQPLGRLPVTLAPEHRELHLDPFDLEQRRGQPGLEQSGPQRVRPGRR